MTWCSMNQHRPHLYNSTDKFILLGFNIFSHFLYDHFKLIRVSTYVMLHFVNVTKTLRPWFFCCCFFHLQGAYLYLACLLCLLLCLFLFLFHCFFFIGLHLYRSLQNLEKKEVILLVFSSSSSNIQ